MVNLDAKCREFTGIKPGESRDMDPNDAWLVIRNSEIMCGRMDKSTIGAGKKDSIFYVILRDFGPDEAVKAMNRLAKLCARQLTNRGFSIGVGDVFPSEGLKQKKEAFVATAYEACDELIDAFKRGKLEEGSGMQHGTDAGEQDIGHPERSPPAGGRVLHRHAEPQQRAADHGQFGLQGLGNQRRPDGGRGRPADHRRPARAGRISGQEPPALPQERQAASVQGLRQEQLLLGPGGRPSSCSTPFPDEKAWSTRPSRRPRRATCLAG